LNRNLKNFIKIHPKKNTVINKILKFERCFGVKFPKSRKSYRNALSEAKRLGLVISKNDFLKAGGIYTVYFEPVFTDGFKNLTPDQSE